MGNTYCAGAREKIEDGQRATVEFYSRVSEKMKRKVEKAKKNTKERLSIVKLRAKGYALNYFEDNGETKVVTDFENRLPLYLVTLDCFDGFLLTIQSDTGKTVSFEAFIEQLSKTEFFSHIKDVQVEGSPLKNMLTHKSLQAPNGELSVNYLRLLGLLLCASTKRMKADLFYQVVTGHNPAEKKEL